VNEQSQLTFRIAKEGWEFEQIHRLNYQTFVEELPQHEPSPERRLVDQFHDRNTYVVCLKGKKLAGMIAICGQRPFSLDQKLPHLDSCLPPARHACEIRLLAVDKKYRHGQIFWGLLELLVPYAKGQGYNLAVISGNARHEKLYRYLGFTPFGPRVGKAPIQFQPMYLTLETLEERSGAFLPPRSPVPREPLSFLPGPVSIHPSVRQALGREPISHRSTAFQSDLRTAKELLCELTVARKVEVLAGSGTLANDVIAAQLSLLRQPGLILVNGEFGRRLVDQGTRFGLSFETVATNWGEAFDLDALRKPLARPNKISWLWAAHCETSTGVLNDLAGLKRICAEHAISLCLDCISSIGMTPVNLGGVHLASSVSGKGLGSFPGLSMVFYDHPPVPAPDRLPRYLDLGYYAACNGVPFTISSNQLHALLVALQRLNHQRFDILAEDTAWLRTALRSEGFTVVGADANAAPGVVTIALPRGLNSSSVGGQLQEAGYLLSFGSEYLIKRNWIQICMMGEYSRQSLLGVLAELRKLNP
jgi:aspartate aminotransferase-like enzyme/GNAT superfamily N-acetyltransferase